MPVYTQLAEDTFQRSDENPLTASKWTLTTGGVSNPMQLKNRQAIATTIGGNTCSMYYSGVAFPNDQYVEITVGSLVGSGILEFEARATLDSTAGYVMQINPTILVLAGGSIIATPAANVRVGDKFRIECLGTKISFFYNGTLLLSQTDAGRASGVVDLSVAPNAVVTDTGFSKFVAGSLSGVVNPPTTGTLYGVYSGSLQTAFQNPYSMDLMQVVNEGNKVVWNLTSTGITNVNPTNPTSDAILGRFEGSSFSTAFLNPNKLDLIQIQSPGSSIPFHVDYQGNANYV